MIHCACTGALACVALVQFRFVVRIGTFKCDFGVLSGRTAGPDDFFSPLLKWFGAIADFFAGAL